MIWLLACVPVEKPGSSTDSPKDSPETSVECPNPDSIVVEGEAIPGQTLKLRLDNGSPAEWTVPVGTLGGDAGEATWALPLDLAENTAETLMIQAQPQLGEACPTAPLSASVTVDWPETSRAVILYNPGIEGSEEVARAYAEFRSVPEENLCAISAANLDVLTEAELPALVDAVMACVGPQIQYLVPVYGVPYKVEGRISDISGNGVYVTTSLDALLFLGPDAATQRGALYNPLYLPGNSVTAEYTSYQPYGQWLAEHRRHYYLVTRIDGADKDAALALIDRTRIAESGERSGTVYVDGRFGDTPPATDESGSYEAGEWNMWGTRRIFEADGRWPVVWDGNEAEFGTAPAPESCPDALFYAGWYSFYHYNDAFTWAPGAIGGHLDSCSACDIRSNGTWAGGALQRGITATFGAVNEPYVAGMPEYDQFFLYLLDGANFAEAAYESTNVAAWMMVWVGDPFYRPFP